MSSLNEIVFPYAYEQSILCYILFDSKETVRYTQRLITNSSMLVGGLYVYFTHDFLKNTMPHFNKSVFHLEILSKHLIL